MSYVPGVADHETAFAATQPSSGRTSDAKGDIVLLTTELGRDDATVIATGGLAGIVADSTDAFDVVDGQLTIKGICEIYRRMQELG